MNTARVAQLLRELAEALEAEATTAPAPAPAKPMRARPKVPYRVEGEVSELDRQRAKRILESRGFVVNTGKR